MKVLVTGASGFIGRNVLLALPRDWRIVATCHRDESFPEFLRERSLEHVTPVRVDLADGPSAGTALQAFKAFDACVYLAANGDPAYSARAPAQDLRANALALLNVLAAAKFGHFLFFSSGAVYDGLQGMVDPESAVRPTLPYAISKWASERYVLHAKSQGGVESASIVRFFGAYGPYEPARKIYGRLVRQFAFAKKPEFSIRGDGRNLIDAMYVDDAVRGIQSILANARDTRTFDFYSGAPLTLKDLVAGTAREFGLEAQIEYLGEVPEYIEFRSRDRTMQTEFGFKPAVALSEGLRRFETWMSQEEKSCQTLKSAP
ncbi:MAG: NAD(P)-dependent oxidoreductase [Usitatibacter sp.]